MSSDKEEKKSLGSSVASDIREKREIEESLPKSASSPKKDEEK